MDKALYRKYRSKKLDEVAGQQHITKTLKNAVKSGKISHAYLLSGPRGVGKTSVARILAHEFNGIKYDDEALQLDIIEIDAASNRRIEEIRDLREKVHIAPASLKYKVYIIDEAHMLTKEAFNALLKTLEEPPEHCVFILATTEVQKLPETIISRTQHFSFQPIDEPTLNSHLKYIAKKESIDITDEALYELAAHSGGSFRDGISLLDQLRHFDKKISIDHVQALLGLPPKQLLDELYSSLKIGDASTTVKTLESLQTGGYDPKTVAKQLFTLIRKDLLEDSSHGSQDLIKFSKMLLKVSTSQRPAEYLELICLEFSGSAFGKNDIPAETAIPSDEPTHIEIKPEPKTQKNKHQKSDFSLDGWPQLLGRIKQTAPALYTVLRLAKTRFDGRVLELGFAFNLHYKKATDVTHKKILAEAISQEAENLPKIEYVLDKNLASDIKPANYVALDEVKMEPDEGGDLSTINNIFGSAEILNT